MKGMKKNFIFSIFMIRNFSSADGAYLSKLASETYFLRIRSKSIYLIEELLFMFMLKDSKEKRSKYFKSEFKNTSWIFPFTNLRVDRH